MNWTVRLCVGLVALVCLSIGTTHAALAHGTDIAYTVGTQIQLQAAFDNGEPMANAQITVYAPDDPAEPWLVGEADADGYFAFAPDTAIPGRWDVFVRTAGHGDTLYFDIDDTAAITGAASAGGGFTVPQIILMSASVIWGTVGTALFFARGRGETSTADNTAPTEQKPQTGSDELVTRKVVP